MSTIKYGVAKRKHPIGSCSQFFPQFIVCQLKCVFTFKNRDQPFLLGPNFLLHWIPLTFTYNNNAKAHNWSLDIGLSELKVGCSRIDNALRLWSMLYGYVMFCRVCLCVMVRVYYIQLIMYVLFTNPCTQPSAKSVNFKWGYVWSSIHHSFFEIW